MHGSVNAPSIAASNPNVDPESLHSVSTAKHNASVLGSTSDSPDKLSVHKVTPLIRSDILSSRTGHNIYLKLDALQPSGSFKIRGVGRTVAIAHEKYGPKAHIVTSSGGNAGLAAATACKMLHLKCTIYVPSSTEDSVVALLRKLDAEVIVGGDSWDAADAPARALVDKTEGAVYIHPFIGDDLIQGHSSIVQEIYPQLEELSPGQQPDLIACTVGGGGLIQGILRGITELQHQAQSHARSAFKIPKVVATQDFGADSFSQSFNLWLNDPIANPEAHVTLNAITSKATSMGTKKCSPVSLKAAREYAVHGACELRPHTSASNGTNGHSSALNSEIGKTPKYLSTVIQSDPLAAASCWQFKRDHDLMVELSCGAALSIAYHSDRLLQPLLKSIDGSQGPKNIVIVVCGGSKVDQDMLDAYERSYGNMRGKGEAQVDGVDV